jgi:tRNASer (uridine44-2'-O)-methyltransferase
MASIAELGNTFSPVDLRTQKPSFALPEELWESVMATPCRFSPEIFQDVITNIIKNPNIASTYVFRAEIFWDSINHPSITENPEAELYDGFIKHMKAEYRPLWISFPDYRWQRTIVIKQIPRNPQLDKPLVETCHIFSQTTDEYERHLMVYLPHVSTVFEIPYYHPPVSAFAVHHEWHPTTSSGALSLHFRLYPRTTVDTKLNRVAYNFLKIVHKHGVGRVAGYQKRVHHDVVVEQKKFQDTYTRLKIKYAKQLISGWVEQTDPSKHVFEDLGIAAFLIELWDSIYSFEQDQRSYYNQNGVAEKRDAPSKPKYPGFVDIGCGNGVLVYILNSEGYSGWGFDTRQRKTWKTFPPNIQQNLKEMLLVPSILGNRSPQTTNGDKNLHSGIFAHGTFIISNHADELTAWTPLLAYLNNAPFIAIPCCSHNLAGARCRFKSRPDASSTPKSLLIDSETAAKENGGASLPNAVLADQPSPGPSSGSLARPKSSSKPPSAYATLTAYVSSLASELGFEAEKEVLRIPSTRNIAVIGRHWHERGKESFEAREEKARQIVNREIGSIETVGKQWVERARMLAKGKSSNH